MANENFTTYTEVDPNSHISTTTSRVTLTNINNNEVAYLYKDKGVDYFSGNFTIYLDLRITSFVTGANTSIWAMANDLGSVIDLYDGDKSFYYIRCYNTAATPAIQLLERDTTQVYTWGALYGISVDTTYYLTIIRNESVGTYGTLYLYIYSDSARTSLVTSGSITLHTSTKDFRYLYGVQTTEIVGDKALSGYVENLIEDFDSPALTTQSVTNISGTTATGNGTITDLGNTSVSQHGHCWSTSHNPTTSDSKTTLGAGSVGVFTSSITGLTAGTKYYVKAYATNGGGTSYGEEVYFTADSGTVSPYDPLTRVSGITRIFYSGFGGSPVYQTILALGGMSNTYVSPMSDRETQSALGTREDINGQGYTQLDFTSWMQRNNFAAIMKLFGHFPTYKEWVEWRKKGGADILGLMK